MKPTGLLLFLTLIMSTNAAFSQGFIGSKYFRVALSCSGVPDAMEYHFQANPTLADSYAWTCVRLKRYVELDHFLKKAQHSKYRSRGNFINAVTQLRLDKKSRDEVVQSFGSVGILAWKVLHMAETTEGELLFHFAHEPATLEERLKYWIALERKYQKLNRFVEAKFVTESYQACNAVKPLLRKSISARSPIDEATAILMTMLFVCDREAFNEIDASVFERKGGFLFKIQRLKKLSLLDLQSNYPSVRSSWSIFDLLHFPVFNSYLDSMIGIQ